MLLCGLEGMGEEKWEEKKSNIEEASRLNCQNKAKTTIVNA